MSEELVRVYMGRDFYEMQMVRAALEAAGLQVAVMGDALPAGAVAGIVAFVDYPLQIHVRAEDESVAREVMAEMKHDPAPHEPWICPQCGEEVDGELVQCWSCGREEPR